MKKYTSDPITKKEFAKFLEWYKEQKDIDNLEPEKVVDKYLEKADIAVSDIMVIRNVKDRNPNLELGLCIGTIILGWVLIHILFSYVDVNSYVMKFIHSIINLIQN